MKERKKERRKEGKKNFSPDFLLVWCGVVWGEGRAGRGGAGQDKIFHH